MREAVEGGVGCGVIAFALLANDATQAPQKREGVKRDAESESDMMQVPSALSLWQNCFMGFSARHRAIQLIMRHR